MMTISDLSVILGNMPETSLLCLHSLDPNN